MSDEETTFGAPDPNPLAIEVTPEDQEALLKKLDAEQAKRRKERERAAELAAQRQASPPPNPLAAILGQGQPNQKIDPVDEIDAEAGARMLGYQQMANHVGNIQSEIVKLLMFKDQFRPPGVRDKLYKLDKLVAKMALDIARAPRPKP